MNEVSQVRPAALQVLSNSSGKSDASKKLSDQATITTAQPEPVPVKVEVEASTRDAEKGKQLDEALGTMQDFVQNVKRELQFSVDKDLGRTVVKVVDSESGDLIRQIPEELFLELARKVKEHGEVNLINATG
jgi:flagellar protein FlaG